MDRLKSGTFIKVLIVLLTLTGCSTRLSAPSSVPQTTSTPKPHLTAVPTSMPQPHFTAVPTSMPQPLSTAVPTSMPQPLPTAIPTSMPQPLPTTVSTSTPQPLPTAVVSSAPEHVKLTLAYGIVVAFADDLSLGRIAYVTHVPSGAQAVLDTQGKIIDRHYSSGADDEVLDVVLAEVESMARIRKGLGYEGSLPRNPIADWIDLIRFDGVTYYRRARKGSGISNEEERLNQSQLGPLLYRVAFSLDSNLLPSGYQIQDGDAAYLQPGTAIHSVIGYDSSLRLAAMVNGEIRLYVRSP